MVTEMRNISEFTNHKPLHDLYTVPMEASGSKEGLDEQET